MRTRNLILIMAIVLGFLASSNAFAIDPIAFSTDKAVSKTEMIIEKEIKLQDWMVDAEVFATRDAVSMEKSLDLKNWMIADSWSKQEHADLPDPGLKVEDWMLRSFDPVQNVE